MKRLTANQHQLIVNALDIAAEQYAKDEETMRGTGHERAVVQFHKQADEALALRAQVMEADALMLYWDHGR